MTSRPHTVVAMEPTPREARVDTQKPQGYHLTELPAEPSAEPGCADCLSLVVARQNARSNGDYSGVSDRNVQLRAHHAEAH